MEKYIKIENTNYSISNKGNVKNDKTNKILVFGISTTGYKFVNIKSKSTKIHRLVAKAFIPNEHGYNIINHIDGDKLNNNVENLEWCTQSHNLKHAFNIGLRKPVINIEGKNGYSKKVIDLKTNKIYDSLSQVVRLNVCNVKYSALKAMLNGQNNNYTTLVYL